MAYIKLEDLQQFPIRIDHYDKEHGDATFVYGIESVLEYADNLPTYTFDGTATKHGYWILRRSRKIHKPAIYQCSCCGELRSSFYDDIEAWKYCPCGAKMDADSETI